MDFIRVAGVDTSTSSVHRPRRVILSEHLQWQTVFLFYRTLSTTCVTTQGGIPLFCYGPAYRQAGTNAGGA